MSSAPFIPKSAKTQKPKEPEKFKPQKPKVGKASAKMLVECQMDLPREAILWVERWLVQLVQERSLPPQIAGENPFGALAQLLAPRDVLEVLERIRKEFRQSFPYLFEKEKEDFAFLEEALKLEENSTDSEI